MSIDASELEELGYEKILAITLEGDKVRPGTKSLRFTVGSNYNIYVSPNMHAFLRSAHGIDSSEVLAEGYVHFHPNGSVKEVFFYDAPVGRRENPDEVKKLNSAIGNKIIKAIESS